MKHAEKDLQKLHDDYIAQDRRADQGERSRDHGSVRRPSHERAHAPHRLRRHRGPDRARDRARTEERRSRRSSPSRRLGAWEFFRIARASGLRPLDDVGIVLAGLDSARRSRALSRRLSSEARSAAVVARSSCWSCSALAIWLRGVEGKPLSAVATRCSAWCTPAACSSYGYAIRYHEYAFAATTSSVRGSLACSAFRPAACCCCCRCSHVGVGHRRVLRRPHDRAAQAHSVGESRERRSRARSAACVASMLVAWRIRDVACLRPARISASLRRSACLPSARSSASRRRSATRRVAAQARGAA